MIWIDIFCRKLLTWTLTILSGMINAEVDNFRNVLLYFLNIFIIFFSFSFSFSLLFLLFFSFFLCWSPCFGDGQQLATVNQGWELILLKYGAWARLALARAWQGSASPALGEVAPPLRPARVTHTGCYLPLIVTIVEFQQSAEEEAKKRKEKKRKYKYQKLQKLSILAPTVPRRTAIVHVSNFWPILAILNWSNWKV